MPSVVCRSLIFILVHLNSLVSAALTTDSRDAAIVINSSVSFRCRTNGSTRIRWQHERSKNSTPVLIYNGDDMRKGLESRFTFTDTFTSGIRQSQLTIDHVESSDSGKYGCSEKGTNKGSIFFELAVLGSDPVCSMNLSSTERDIAEFECISVICSFNITGNLLPSIRCSSLQLTFRSSGDNATSSSVRHTAVFQVFPPVPRVSTISCITQFNRSLSASDDTSAIFDNQSGASNSKFQWISPEIHYQGELQPKGPGADPVGISGMAFVITTTLVMTLLAALTVSVIGIIITLRKRHSADIGTDRQSKGRHVDGLSAGDEVRNSATLPVSHELGVFHNTHFYHQIDDTTQTTDTTAEHIAGNVENSCYEGLEQSFTRPHQHPVKIIYSGLGTDGGTDADEDEVKPDDIA